MATEFEMKEIKSGDPEAARHSSMAAPQKSVTVKFENLNYSVSIKAKKTVTEKVILNNVSGMFKPGKFTAIMGNSGSGKTSLLNAGAVKGGKISGDLIINGEKMDTKFMKKMSAFVMQDDVILGTMTVREAITMSALLRLPPEIPKSEKLDRVDEIISMLRLDKAQNTVIGSTRVKGVSGGERKRTGNLIIFKIPAMAMEMVTNPSIILLDEPTSGLDSFTAYSVCTTLSDLAEQGRTVVATIHQPSSDIFLIFDDLLLLSEGRVAYYGPSSAVIDYFTKIDYPFPDYVNPADFIFMHILNNSEEAKQADKKKDALNKVLLEWDNSENKKVMLNTPATQKGLPADVMKVNASFYEQFRFLLTRAGKNVWRNALMVRARLGQAVFLGILLGLVYRDVSSRPLKSQTQALGIFLASVFEDVQVALFLAPMLIMPMMVFSGFLINNNNIPVYFNWIKYLSPIKYGFTAAAKNEFQGLVMTDQFGSLTGEKVLDDLAFTDELPVDQNLYVLLSMFIILIGMAYMALWRATKKVV
ncbi:P-loop containing nucleoside triphosphate hydrolase protein [Rozella allomycis CSF55]|uniref:P-loop containing nucleoside triphosphate hydrolase protein n=1 Tax=Rozella allomycis (strain CSF55) TaxID=988480 RepID=A0A075B1Y3_ROZAC|nr:P-loop containing nucleoside triphosphate hydrolase domain-containing protein [Rozella allomycis CSF55]RKP18610.1 P-loop containing nucleoside triphosphate hydrolase protein [Rozella allomycis CSF55]|eukprot:EPZ36380.1 P-loop containing nucleoside triphosphate hydrolase domain-containing protein [Rozella allomycis CSF55]